MSELVEWSPLPRPTRSSPFYSLKSVAFSKASGSGLGRLPPLRPDRSDHLGEFQSSAWARAPSAEDACSEARLAEEAEQFLQRPRARRDVAWAEKAKVEKQIQEATARLEKEAVLRAATELRTQEAQQKAQDLGEVLAEELACIREQQRLLRALRAAVREQKGLPCRHSSDIRSEPPVEAATPAAAAPSPASEPVVQPPQAPPAARSATPKRPSTRGSSRRASPECPPAPQAPALEATLALPPAEGGGTTLELLLAEMQQVSAAFQGDVRRRSPAPRSVPRSGPAEKPPRPGSDDEEDAEIEVVRAPDGSSMARLRHPSGAEATVDLRTGEVRSWRHSNGAVARAAPGEAEQRVVSLMRPSMLDDGGPGRRTWRLVHLDDSNNEPSVTLVCGGDGGAWPWHLRRTLTLTVEGLRENLVVENTSPSGPPATFEMASPGSAPESVSVSPGACWTAVSRWSD